MLSLSRREITRVLLFVTAWRAWMFAVAWFANFTLPFRSAFTVPRGILEEYPLPEWISSWANFDGFHYLTIGYRGYIGTGLVQAFFPVFPVGILHTAFKLTDWPMNKMILTGVIASFLASLILALFWYALLKEWFNARVAAVSLAMLFFFPTGFYFGAVYSESVFMALLFATMWCATRRQWGITAILAAVLSGTRVIGIVIVPALLLELYFQDHSRVVFSVSQFYSWLRRRWKTILLIFCGSIGLLLYMAFLWWQFGDPVYFKSVQAQFRTGREATFVWYPQVVWRSIKIVATSSYDLQYPVYVSEFLIATVGLGILLWSLKYVRFSWWFFAVAVFFIPPTTGTLSSMPRYFIVSWPFFVVLAYWCNTKFKALAWLLLSTVLLTLATIMFIQGYWIA